MSDLDAATPRVFLIRHGETEWTKTGQYMGYTEVRLTPNGMEQARATGLHFVGPNKLVDLNSIARIFVSPRERAKQTFGQVFHGHFTIESEDPRIVLEDKITEWDYGDYEGMVVDAIRQKRLDKGLDPDIPWNIWRDGCEGGENPEQITQRLDSLIQGIRDIQAPHINGGEPANVVLLNPERGTRVDIAVLCEKMAQVRTRQPATYDDASGSGSCAKVGLWTPTEI